MPTYHGRVAGSAILFCLTAAIAIGQMMVRSTSNGNSNTTQWLSPNDAFVFTFGITGGSVLGVDSKVTVNSQSFPFTDFSLMAGPNAKQVTLTYIGTGTSFRPKHRYHQFFECHY
jgi:hypothetical protein